MELAVDLVHRFPALGDPTRSSLGSSMWFCAAAHSPSGPTGFLEERLKNQRRKLAKSKKNPSSREANDMKFLNYDSDNDFGETKYHIF